MSRVCFWFESTTCLPHLFSTPRISQHVLEIFVCAFFLGGSKVCFENIAITL
uniref:Uncharacterized protein n=1 Tax=Rhizophora mucronata TaxID=61149 RepID=A0A2P2NW95_RHIMU